MPHEYHEEPVVVERYAESCPVLVDPRYLVPEVDSTATSGLDWLRANVSRFCNGADHDRRRAMVEVDLARIDTGWLERAAHERTLAELRRPSPAPPGPRERSVRVARAVPVATLASSLGVAEDRLDAVAEAVTAVAAAYHPGSNPDAEVRRRADQGVERLLHLVGRGAPEELANRAALLVQACDPTARLVVSAFELALLLSRSGPERWPVSAVVSETLRYNPAVRSMRRQRLDDEGVATSVLVDVAAANRDPDVFVEPERFNPGRPDRRHLTFGYGLRPCPGAGHAVALACGVVAALLSNAEETDRCS
jgi:cytochrome P450